MRRFVAPALVAIVVAVGWVWALPAAPVRQPLAFPHAKHQAMDCTACHSGAASGAHATIPEPTFCARCHATPPAGTDAVWNTALTNKTFGWVKVNRLPTHVMFSHRRHVTLGHLACESCHGEMKTRTTPVVAVARRIEMKTCLACHQHEGSSEDCDACHR